MTVDVVAILEWVWKSILILVASAHALSCLLGIAIGIMLAEFLAHMLPAKMDSYYADRVTRLVCLGVSLLTTFALDTTTIGLFLAVLSGLAGPTMHGFLLRWVAFRWPKYTPKALVQGPLDTVSPRPLIPSSNTTKDGS
jgi:hypothetical protein